MLSSAEKDENRMWNYEIPAIRFKLDTWQGRIRGHRLAIVQL